MMPSMPLKVSDMNQKPIIKLKNTEITKIYTDIDSEIIHDYSCEYSEIFSKIEFTFSNGYVFKAELEEVDFSTFVSFFYGKDYSTVSEFDFCDQFVENFYIKTDSKAHRVNTYCVHARILGTEPLDHIYQYMVEETPRYDEHHRWIGNNYYYFKEYISS